jgi:FkbM family methyltransferase
MSKLSRRWRRVRQAVHEWAGATYELDGCRFVLPPWADDIKRNIRRGHYEVPERRLVLKWLKGDAPVVELGGSFGIVSGVIGSRLGAAIPHVIVEANPILIEICTRNAATARPAGAPVTVVSAAIAYGDGNDVYFLPSGGFLGSRLANAGDADVIKVEAIMLHELLAGQGIGVFDLVCDIEGAELDMLRQDGNALSQCRLAIIELHADVFAAKGASQDDFIRELSELGFEIVESSGNVIVARNREFNA